MTASVEWRERIRRLDPDHVYAGALAVYAFVVRVAIDLHGSSSTGDFDEGVYFGTANALTRGVIPYRDFVSVHPPFSALLFAATTGPVTAISGPSAGFVATRVLAALAGAITTWLLYRCALHIAGRRAAIVTAVLYASFAAAIFTEGRVLLDPFMVVLAVGGATVFLERSSRVSGVVAGVLLGLSVSTKLTGALFVVAAIGAGLALGRDRRRTVVTGASTVATFAVVSSPFLLLAGARTWFDQVVMAQLDRPTGAALPGNIGSLDGRLSALIAWGPLGNRGTFPIVVVILGALLIVAAVAWGVTRVLRAHDERVAFWTAAAVMSIISLLVGPTFYTHYAVLAGVPLAVLFGGAAAAALARIPRRALATSLVAVLVAVCLVWQAKVTWFVEPPSTPEVITTAIAELDRTGCVFLDQPQVGFLAGIVPQRSVAEPLIDPFGGLLEVGRAASHSALEALHSTPAQERLRVALDACPWVVLAVSPDGQFTWTPETRDRFLATHQPVGMADGFTIWKSPI